MFKYPELYLNNNGLQRRDAKAAIEKHACIFKWKNDGTESVLDFGTGPGDILMDFILPRMPENFDRLIGSDLSLQMVEYGDKEFGTEKIQFRQMDIAKDVNSDILEKMDVVTSFFCLNFVKEQERALKNVFNYLKPGGRCLLVSLKTFPPGDAFIEMLQMPKYETYKDKISALIPHFTLCEDTKNILNEMLKRIGFIDFEVEIAPLTYIYEIETFKDLVRSVNPYNNVSNEQKAQEFIDDFVEIIDKKKLISKDRKTVAAKYNLITITAKKSISN